MAKFLLIWVSLEVREEGGTRPKRSGRVPPFDNFGSSGSNKHFLFGSLRFPGVTSLFAPISHSNGFCRDLRA